ncbi:MAG: hypothetical protein ACI845_004290 [Gammaproteobacteria bacterium]|jgi:hypothetical protein
MKIFLLFVFPALILGFGVGIFSSDEGDEIEASDSSQSNPIETALSSHNASSVSSISSRQGRSIDKIYQLLKTEIRARQSLQLQVDDLLDRLAMADSVLSEEIVSEPIASAELKQPSSNTASDEEWFNTQALLDAGLGSGRATELKNWFESIEMDRLFIRDQSIREEWDRTQFREAMVALSDKADDLKNQMSENEYDAYLFASGQPNRVSIASVLASAPAGEAGIQAGDHVVRYDNRRIYNGLSLREATTEGNAGDTVLIEVERDGNTLHLYTVRGPLGIRMDSISIAP